MSEAGRGGAAAPRAAASGARTSAANGDVPWLVVRGARHNNLQNIDAWFPLGRLTCVTGVSGSGKSSLVLDILYEALARDLNGARATPGKHDGIEFYTWGDDPLPGRSSGRRTAVRDPAARKSTHPAAETKPASLPPRPAAPEPAMPASGRPSENRGLRACGPLIDKVIAIDQSPIGRTPRSNPATYIKLFDEIRELYTRLPDARLRGYRPGRFSFNVPAGRRGGGRCEACEGNGSNRIEMDFLADVWVTCPVCEGRRFSRETLQIRYGEHRRPGGYSIADVLEMDVQEALEVFENQPRIRAMLQTLHDVGLDYIKLGQPSPTLSGGEAQRVKLARELVRRSTGRTLYVLDEPTTGLHFEDIRRLLGVLHGFVDAGNTVVVIEHNLDVIKTADWIIDLGPEGGAEGGRIVAEGTPEQVAACEASHTGRALREVLRGRTAAAGVRAEGAPGRRRPAASGRSAAPDAIQVWGARQHNLRDITVSLPRHAMTVCTGVSGSGKTSFAIDTVFTEGYRRYVESLSAYARQFLGQLAKPDVERVEGLSPAICIEQKAASRSPRSTVGTVTEIYDYMRVLWARLGTPYCPTCNLPVGTQTADQIVDRVLALPDGTAILILAPVALEEGETYTGLFNRLKASGYSRVRIDGQLQETARTATLDPRRKHRVEVVVDRTLVRTGSRGRISESVEHALALGNGLMTLVVEAAEPGVQQTTGTNLNQQREDLNPARRGGPEAPATSHGSHTDAATPSPPSQQPGSGPEIPAPGRTASPAAREMLFSQKLACTRCGTSFEELSPHHFSFNSPLGWCETCEGLGVQRGAPAGEIIRRPERTLFDGALAGWSPIDRRTPLGRLLAALCRHLGVSPDLPLEQWTPAQRQALLFGQDPTGGTGSPAWFAAEDGQSPESERLWPGVRVAWRGLFPALDAATRHSWMLRYRLQNVVTEVPCLSCRGGRLRRESAAVRLETQARAETVRSADGPPTPGGPTIGEVCELPLKEALAFFRGLKLDERRRQIAGELLREICNRLQFLVDVGLDYLHLNRAAPTLSGGEAQRIRLASQIGSGLSGVLYVLDEPTIGLHPRDTQRLVAALRKLRELGNTLLLVEHDREVIASADRLIDFGPRAGSFGGEVVAEGVPEEFRKPQVRGPQPRSLTRGYLSGELAIPIPSNRRPVPRPPVDPVRQSPGDGGLPDSRGGADVTGAAASWLVVRGARQNNLKNLDVPIPLGRLVCVTGVSGSGKSSLVHDILWSSLANRLNSARLAVGEHDAIEFYESSEAAGPRTGGLFEPVYVRTSDPLIDKVINVDQSPIGATPASNPATYTGVFDWIRELFARLPESKLRGYSANRFSFNRPGGRCEACEGNGQKRIEMHFMPDVWITCESCGGKRYTAETLAVKFKGRSIADVLDMRVSEALGLFDSVPKVRRLLQTLVDVGLDYVQLGQPAPTLSGGEAQRVKLAAELGKPATGRTLYILDEPTTGLHFDDIRKLLEVLQRLVDLGNTVLVVEHNLDVLKCADWIIDLGPEGGEAGGDIVAMGTPEQVSSSEVRSQKSEVTEADRAARESGGGPASDFLLLTSDFTSHTGAALAPVLAAGPYQPRAVYDAAAHAAREIEADRIRFGDVGKGVRMPWQVDGRKWHLEQRSSRDGRPRRWEPAALEFVEQLVQRIGRGLFAPTNWNERASVEITAPGAPVWFLHALTGGEWLLELYFRVPPGTFNSRRLEAQLGLKRLDERDDLPIYGNEPRVEVRRRADGFDAVAVYVHDRREIDTPAFRRFVREAVAAYRRSL